MHPWKTVQPLGCIVLLSCAGAARGAADAGSTTAHTRTPDAGPQRAPAAKGGTGGSAGQTAASAAQGGSRSAAADAGTRTSSGTGGTVAARASGDYWKPKPNTSWQYQLSGKLDTSFDATVYDIDLFETSAADIDRLHQQQRKVVCYFDTAYEPNRDDSPALAPYKGNPIDGWPGQFWLDIRQPAVLTVMLARLDVAQSKQCDGVEADDVDSRSNKPGFAISAADQQGFIIQLSDAAHARGLAFGLKNDLDEISALLSHADFAVNEQCFEYDECDSLTPFIDAGKPVFNVEYTDSSLEDKAKTVCPDANARNFDSLIKHIDVDPPRYSCR
jgi:Glycoside-hydrolase family GH114